MKKYLYMWIASALSVATLASCGKDDSGPAPTLSVQQSALEFVVDGETLDLNLESSGTEWKAASDAVWLHFDPASGNGNATIKVTADPNATGLERTASITVSGQGVATVTVAVSQAKPLEGSDFIGKYRAEYDKWDLDAKSAFYPILEDGSYDYVNIITAREFCEAYAAAYNAAENPQTPVTAEDCSYNYYDDSRYMRFEITKDSLKMVRFVEVAGGTGMSIFDIDGTYVYDAAANAFIVHDVSVEDDPRDITLTVAEFVKGQSLALTVPDYYWWCAVSYDQQTSYLPWVSATYHTKPVE